MDEQKIVEQNRKAHGIRPWAQLSGLNFRASDLSGAYLSGAYLRPTKQ